MSSNALDYVKSELNKIKAEIDSVENDIRSSEIEIDTINKNIKKIEKNADHTGDLFHSVTATDSDDVRIISLKDNRENLKQRIEELTIYREDLLKDYVKLKNIIEDDEDVLNVSRETTSNSQISNFDIINFNEADRKRISMDIHDTVIQNLTALIHKQEFIKQIIDNDINRAKLEIKNNIDILKESIDELRNIIFDLRPMSLDDLGFKAAVLNLCDNISSSQNKQIIKYSVICDDNLKVDNAISISVLRIIRELLSNSIKHSSGEHININLECTSNEIIIIFNDDGTGFDFNRDYFDSNNNTGFGIKNIKDRILILNGMIEYDNNNGSNYNIRIPL